MKTIQIMSLKLENFKCHRLLTMTFDGESRTIYGDNAAGKTSIYDGLTWLLFGKTSCGSADNELLKPVGADGRVLDHNAVTAVEAVLLVTDATPSVSCADSSPAEQGSQIPRQPSAATPFSKGDKYGAYGKDVGATPSVGCADSSPAEQGSLVRTVTLRKELQEVWTSRRGSSQQVYDGNTCAFYIDGVPMKKNEYDRRVAELVDETAFRLLTSASFFAETMPWKERRAVLAELCGNVTDMQLMYEDERFTGLIEKIGTGSLEDYRNVLTARKNGLSADRNTIPARIAEQEQVVATLCAVDYEAVKTELDVQEAAIRALQEKKNSIANTAEIEKLNAQLEVLSSKSRSLDAENRAFRAEQNKAMPDTKALEQQSRTLHEDLEKAKRDIQNNEELKKRIEGVLDEHRKHWEAANALTFNEDERCPTCGQKLPQSRLEAAKKEFELNKKKVLADIELSAGGAKNTLLITETSIANGHKNVESLLASIGEIDEALQKAKEAAAAVTVSDMDGYAEKKAEIEAEGKAVSTELSALMKESDGAKKAVELKISDARLKYKELSDALGKKASLEFAEKRIEELRAQQQEAAKLLEEIDRELFLIEDFVRFKAKRVEERVNGCFRLATFRLFRELVKGGLEECCDAVHDGVPYPALNNGMRINIGLDIIRTLSEHYGVRVPLFVDNAESVTELADAGTQMIRLVVSAQDKTLRVE